MRFRTAATVVAAATGLAAAPAAAAFAAVPTATTTARSSVQIGVDASSQGAASPSFQYGGGPSGAPGAWFQWGFAPKQGTDLRVNRPVEMNVGGVTSSYSGLITVCLDATQNLQDLHQLHLMCSLPATYKGKVQTWVRFPKTGNWFVAPEMYKVEFNKQTHREYLVPLYGTDGQGQILHVRR